MDPAEGTSNGRNKRNRKPKLKPNLNAPILPIKEEIKEEPIELSELHEYSRQPRSSTVNDINVIGTDSDSDVKTNSDIDTNYVKDEIKIECKEEEVDGEKSKDESDGDQNEQSNGIDVGDSDDGNRNNPVSDSNSNDKGRTLNPNSKGRNRILTKKRDMANEAKKPRPKPKKVHKCKQCDYFTSKKTDLTRHIRTHTGEKPFECDICSKSFALKTNFNRHKRTHRSQFGFHCSKCQCGFAEEDDKLKHESKCHVPQFKCYMCKYSTLHLNDLKKHMRFKHTGEKPFECSVCFGKYATKFELNSHSRVHAKQLPFNCSKCGRRFVNQNEAKLHEKHCKRRQFECFLCHQYKSFQKCHLKVHMRTNHMGEKPFRCTVCKKKFAQNGELKRHSKTHSKQRGINC